MASFVSREESDKLLAEKNAAYEAWEQARHALDAAQEKYGNARKRFYEAADAFDNSHD